MTLTLRSSLYHAEIEVGHLLIGLIPALIKWLGLYGADPNVGVERLLSFPWWVYGNAGYLIKSAWI